MEFDLLIPFVQHLGFELQVFDGGTADIRFVPQPEHLNSFGVTHGGALMCLLDVCMAHAARSVAKDMGVVTIEMKTSFLQAAQGPLLAQGRLLYRSATLAFTEASVLDGAGQLCAHATATFKYLRRLPTTGRSSLGLSPNPAAIQENSHDDQ